MVYSKKVIPLCINFNTYNFFSGFKYYNVVFKKEKLCLNTHLLISYKPPILRQTNNLNISENPSVVSS